MELCAWAGKGVALVALVEDHNNTRQTDLVALVEDHNNTRQTDRLEAADNEKNTLNTYFGNGCSH